MKKFKFITERYTLVMFLLFWLVIGIIIVAYKMNVYYIRNDYSFVLIGKDEVSILEGEEYKDEGFRILSKEGIDLYNYVVVDNNVDYNKVGSYEVIYRAKYNKISKKLVRRVNVNKKETINKWVTIPTYDGSNQTTHPKVLYFENGFNGYKYWMVSTPYPSLDAYYENPSITVSNNGIDWTCPKGFKNPVSGYPNIYRDDSYYSDPYMIYDNGKIEIFFRKTKSNLNGLNIKNGFNYMYYISSSDGINYSKPKIILDNNYNEQYMSMSVVKRDGKYKIWYVNYNNKIRYIESKDLVEFTEPIDVNIENFDKKLWHKEIQYVNGKYVCIFMIKYKLFYTESLDGINFIEPKEIYTNLNTNYKYNIYKSSFIITDNYIELFIPYRLNYKWEMKYIKTSKKEFYNNLI